MCPGSLNNSDKIYVGIHRLCLSAFSGKNKLCCASVNNSKRAGRADRERNLDLHSNCDKWGQTTGINEDHPQAKKESVHVSPYFLQ